MITILFKDEDNNIQNIKVIDQDQAYRLVRNRLKNGLVMKDIDYISDEKKCRECGCDDQHACKGGCYWVENDLCSQCFEKQTSYTIKLRRLELVGIEELEDISEIEIIAEEIENEDRAYGFIHGYVEGKANLVDSEVIFDEEDCIGSDFICISIWQNDKPITEFFFDEVQS